jgi:hypothetical protein
MMQKMLFVHGPLESCSILSVDALGQKNRKVNERTEDSYATKSKWPEFNIDSSKIVIQH